MNVLLINPSCGFQPVMKSSPLGLLSIATYLKERGYDVRLYDRKLGKLSPRKAVQGFPPDAVGVSVASTADICDGVRISRWFRARGIPVIWGGQFSSVAPKTILREGGADYVVIKEGEITFLELLQAIETKGEAARVKGIVYLEPSGGMRLTPPRELADLAGFPGIDWSFINLPDYFYPDPKMGCERMLNLYSSKGCPGHCSFCYNKNFNHSQCRKRPNGLVVGEMQELAAKYGMDGITFVDEDMFGAGKDDMRDFCRRLRALDLNVKWRCFSRVASFSREDLSMLYDAGCRMIFFGIESGSPETLRRMRKNLDLTAVEDAIHACNEAGIMTTLSFVLGFPDETEGQLRETIRLMRRLESAMNTLMVLAYVPIPHTEAYSELVEAGRLPEARPLREWGRIQLREDISESFSEMSEREFHVIQAYFYWRIFRRKSRRPDEDGAGQREYIHSRIASSLRNILRQSLSGMCEWALSAAKFFLTIAWYAHAYPGIRKKYGLD